VSSKEAELAQIRLERKLKAASQGFTVPEEAATPSSHSCSSILASYLSYLKTTTKRNGRKYNARSIRSRETNIQQFVKVTGRVYAEQITRADLLRYRDFLYGQGRANDTVYNKMAVVVTWLKHNQIVEIKNLFKGEDWPVVRQTKAHPFRSAEITSMMEVAKEHQLLLRLARGTGMRKAELMHAERSDVDAYAKSIHVRDKPKYGWETKTLAGVREIPLGDDLLRDLLKKPVGLLFPNTEGRPDIRLDRRFEEVGVAAEVQPPTDDRACWCHRWRDTYATSLVRSRTLGLMDIARLLGHEDTSMLNIYAEYLLMESAEARVAANSVDEYGTKPGPKLVGKKVRSNVA
jgi:integrase